MRISDSTIRNAIIAALALGISVPAVSQGGFAGAGSYQIANEKTRQILSLAMDGRGVVQAPVRGGEGQVWVFEPARNGFWFIRDARSGFALEPTAGQNSAPVLAAPFHGGPSQQWRIEQAQNGNALIVNYYGRTLDIPEGSGRPGLPVQIYERNGDNNQRFVITPVRGDFGGRWRRPEGGPQTLVCESTDGRRRYCEIDERAAVRLSRQIGSAACREGRTWGRDARGIWVDRGCRAEFEMVMSAVPGRGRGRGRGGDIVRCSSENGRRTYCEADTRGGALLVRQLEGRECRLGETWGFDAKGIWVDRGCRGEFQLGR